MISVAYAQFGSGSQDVLSSMLPLVLIFVIFYFLLIRPQQKRAKDHRAMLSDLKKGDKVITGGGVFATIVKVDDMELTVEMAEGMRVKVLRGTISRLNVTNKPRGSNKRSRHEQPPARPPTLGERLAGMFAPKRPTD